ncbi:hypothetical protein LshimejAT787_0402080 [Lyophyllum shimeji]|uniref:Uncharacterized protein n=1 Tax=Lyophyllum shimeji TaxID=47721 RepID=A0A9P3PKU3_LYOSH|nr:hypothetical protein LshimejAT787_0402080 [Lyophyllum shimeji]
MDAPSPYQTQYHRLLIYPILESLAGLTSRRNVTAQNPLYFDCDDWSSSHHDSSLPSSSPGRNAAVDEDGRAIETEIWSRCCQTNMLECSDFGNAGNFCQPYISVGDLAKHSVSLGYERS